VSLLDDLNTIGTRKNECTAGLLLKSLPEKESAALLKAIDNPDTSLTMLARVLSKHGHEVSRKTLTRHRLRGQKEIGCVCP
jgi:DNA-binding transcriptional regulator WhiA